MTHDPLPNKDRGYRVIKLVTGEELVARIIRSDKNNLVLERPMRVMGCMLEDPSDPAGIIQREMVYMNDYLEHSSTQKVTMPRNAILNILPPSKTIVSAYKQTIARFDHADEVYDKMDEMMEQALDESPNEDGMYDLQDNIRDVISSIVDSILNQHEPPPPPPEPPTEEITDEVWDETDVDKTRKDWGNDWTDWSPDLKDY